MTLYKRRQPLVLKSFTDGLTDEEQAELDEIERQLDEQEEREHRHHLSALDSKIKASKDMRARSQALFRETQKVIDDMRLLDGIEL